MLATRFGVLLAFSLASLAAVSVSLGSMGLTALETQKWVLSSGCVLTSLFAAWLALVGR